jgi:hypothetical protein
MSTPTQPETATAEIGGLDSNYISKLKKRIEAKRKRIEAVTTALAAPSLPGSFVTGRSGQSRAYVRKLDRQLDRTIRLSSESIRLERELAHLENRLAGYEAGRISKSGRLIRTEAQKRARRRKPVVPMAERLFCGKYPCGLVYADRGREEHGDYLRLAFLSYETLELRWSEVSMPEELRQRITESAAEVQARRGEHYQITTSGQTVLLGG